MRDGLDILLTTSVMRSLGDDMAIMTGAAYHEHITQDPLMSRISA